MKVRVFIQSATSPADEPVYSGTDHTFPALPVVGQALRFTDHRAGDFTVISVGYVQDADAFIPAVWLTGSDTQHVYSEPANAAKTPEYRDLNYDVPPDSMETY